MCVMRICIFGSSLITMHKYNVSDKRGRGGGQGAGWSRTVQKTSVSGELVAETLTLIY